MRRYRIYSIYHEMSEGLTLRISVRFFALYRERAGTSQVDMDMEEGATPAVLLVQLQSAFPTLSPIKSALIAVNSEYADLNAPLHEGDELALIPPVSGG
jgi:molybdopterin converting factor subunit 1